MKTIKTLTIGLLSIFVTAISCREEMISTNETQEITTLIQAGTTRNGRLYFPNKESLVATYKELKNQKIEDVQKFVNEKGIESLVPIITEKNEEEVMDRLKARKLNFLANSTARSIDAITVSNEDIYEDLDDLEEVVGDEVYAAMLNGNAEIQVADNIYKYTDVGLFVTPVENYNNLENYLEVREISQNLLEPTESSVKEEFVSNKTTGELTTLAGTDNKINYFIAPIDTFDDGTGGTGGTGGGGYYGGGSTYTPPVEPSMATIVQGLKIGEVRKPWLGNIFGTTWETDDKYESNRRVKVKFYSQNLYLVYVVGCKVKHQFKGWTGLWRKENADKLGIGINSISWKFAHSVTFASDNTPREVYWLDGKMYKAASGTDYVNVGPATMPSFPFSNNATVDAVIQFTTDFTGLTEEQLNKLFWENAWKQANNSEVENNNETVKDAPAKIVSSIRNNNAVQKDLLAYSTHYKESGPNIGDFFPPVYYYNQVAAANYARTYALSSNSSSYRTYANDCTNFISQCLITGGWTETGSTLNRTQSDVWFYNSLGESLTSYTWAGANNHYQFHKVSARSTMGTSTGQLRLGDILQVDFEGDGVVDHTVIVSKEDSSGADYVSYHTTNTLDKPLSQFISACGTSAKFYVWLVKRS